MKNKDKNNLDLGIGNEKLKGLQERWNEPRVRIDKTEPVIPALFNSQQKYMVEEMIRLLSSKESASYHKENFELSYPIAEARDKLQKVLDML